jgi:hypothetical protein
MATAKLEHFHKASLEIGENGDNDTLPYEIDSQFVKENAEAVSDIAYRFFCEVDKKTEKAAADYVNGLQIFSERLLVPTGASGFRVTTKIHPFWNVYLNGLGLCIAEKNEPTRSSSAHSYRLGGEALSFFDRARSWRAYKEATLSDVALENEGSVVVQTDVSSFYEHIYHHRLENCIRDLFPAESTIAVQMVRFLSKLASGRSFGLPVGGQCARILAEVMMSPIDQLLSDAGLVWHRYVDDFTLICQTQQDAYRALSVLSHTLADYGLSLSRIKTTILKANHYRDYIEVQLGKSDDKSIALREIDLHFDPYSDRDSAINEYARLKQTVAELDVEFLLDLELNKTQPDTFIVAQISRTLKFQDVQTAISLCKTILDPDNLNAFRASWSTIMRGIYAVRANSEFKEIFYDIDSLLDKLPSTVSHLLLPEANILHYLRAIRFCRTEVRGRLVRDLYDRTSSETVRRACIDCWRHWPDRPSFNRLRNQWQKMGSEEQRMLWLASNRFGDEGRHARSQLRPSLSQAWRLSFELGGEPSFAKLYSNWAEHVI